MSIKLEVWGDLACFTRPEIKNQRISYDVITPSAARGILEAIYWTPGVMWKIDKIHVLSPIKTVNIVRNEVAPFLDGKQAEFEFCVCESRRQVSTLALQDVHYVIEAHFELTKDFEDLKNKGRVQAIMNRRIKKGQFYRKPYFGNREFPVSFKLWEEKKPIPSLQENCDLGYMFYDFDYSDPVNKKNMLFRAKMEQGIIHVPAINSMEVLV